MILPVAVHDLIVFILSGLHNCSVAVQLDYLPGVLGCRQSPRSRTLFIGGLHLRPPHSQYLLIYLRVSVEVCL